jgi:hypothetical protein
LGSLAVVFVAGGLLVQAMRLSTKHNVRVSSAKRDCMGTSNPGNV